jgi:hypothetical protein
MLRRLLPILPFVCSVVAAVSVAVPGLAHAADAGKPKPAWLKEKHILEVGGYLGGFFTAPDHGLYGDGITKTARPLKTGFNVGLRIAYMPLRFVGIEAEGGVVPTKLDGQGGYKVTMFAARAHVILQTPTRWPCSWWRVAASSGSARGRRPSARTSTAPCTSAAGSSTT